MSQPFSRILHPFDVDRHPRPEPEVARALLARWTSDRAAPCSRSVLRRPPGAYRARTTRDVQAGRRMIDGRSGGRPRPQ